MLRIVPKMIDDTGGNPAPHLTVRPGISVVTAFEKDRSRNVLNVVRESSFRFPDVKTDTGHSIFQHTVFYIDGSLRQDPAYLFAVAEHIIDPFDIRTVAGHFFDRPILPRPAVCVCAMMIMPSGFPAAAYSFAL